MALLEKREVKIKVTQRPMSLPQERFCLMSDLFTQTVIMVSESPLDFHSVL